MNRFPNTQGPERAPRRPGLDRVMYARLALVFGAILMAGFGGGIVFQRELGGSPSGQEREFDDVDAVGNLIEDNYYYRPEPGQEQGEFESSLERNAIDGMLNGLDDEYTRYLVPDQAQIASDELTGEYGGIGVSLVVEGSALMVGSVIPDSPAARFGIAPGDQITRIDNRPFSASADALPTGDLRGPVGSTVTLSLIKGATRQSVTAVLNREAILVNSVLHQMIPGTTYMWIRIRIFGDRTTEELDAALTDASSSGATGVILDLRENGGGWVTAAQDTIGRFVDDAAGPALYEDTTPARGGSVAFPIRSPEQGPTGLPLIVLIDGNTASASEIVAGALRDYDRALVVGEPSYGKGSVQRIFDFPDGASLRVTVAEWFTPSKGRIQGDGITPDVPITPNPGATSAGDPFLNAAAALLDQGLSRPSDRVDTPVPGTPTATPMLG